MGALDGVFDQGSTTKTTNDGRGHAGLRHTSSLLLPAQNSRGRQTQYQREREDRGVCSATGPWLQNGPRMKVITYRHSTGTTKEKLHILPHVHLRPKEVTFITGVGRGRGVHNYADIVLGGPGQGTE